MKPASSLAHLPEWPRLMPRAVAVEYCGGRAATFDRLVKGGLLPARNAVGLWDRKAIDAALDAMNGTVDPTGQHEEWLGLLDGHSARQGRSSRQGREGR